MTDNIEIKVLAVRTTTDDEPDWLFQDPDYEKEDQERFEAWQQEEWTLDGVRTRVVVWNKSTGNTCTYESAGLWGIESDSNDDYFLEIAQQELENLQNEFPQLNDIKIDKTVTWKYE